MKNERAVFARRFRQELLRQGFSTKPVELVKLLARHGGIPVTQQTVSNWLNAAHLPKFEAMHALSKMLGMDAYQLLRDEPQAVREARATWPDQVSGPDRVAFEQYQGLPQEQREAVREMIAALAAAGRQGRE